MYKKTTLENGLRIITVPSKNTKAVSVLALVGTGSKYETKEENGISHFLEHMFFKGTEKRPTPLDVVETLDKVGGIFNAFTSKELTGYWAKVDSRHFELALDWVSDISLNSKFPSKEIEKEKGVIIEEINMYLDTPMSYILDLWEKLLYGDQPAGWLTIGTKKNVLGFKRDNFVNYVGDHYSSKNTVVCVAGNIDEEEAIKKVKDYFSGINEKDNKSKIPVEEKQEKPNILLHHKETDQTHLCLGVRGFDLFDKRKFSQSVLATILGGFMSSRLFMSVREERGLAYYIKSASDSSTDTGYLVTRAGVDHKKAEEAVKVIVEEYRKIREEGVGEKELRKAKDYLRGTLTLSLEASDALASFYAAQEVLEGKALTPEDKFKELEKVTREDLQKVAKEIFKPENLNLALIGPFKDKERFEKILNI
jgi:predicted Zn-dependent peptidase